MQEKNPEQENPALRKGRIFKILSKSVAFSANFSDDLKNSGITMLELLQKFAFKTTVLESARSNFYLRIS